MKFTSADFPGVQTSAIVCLLLIAAGASVVHFANNASRTAQAERSLAQSQRNEIDKKLRRVRSEENEIKEKAALYQRIETRGIIGDEQRLEWIELLKAIRERRKLIDLRYELEPQRPLDGTASNGLTFFASPMRVQLELLHEEDLTRFLNDLREKARALIQVRNCHMQRDAGPNASNPGMHLRAECRIDWITLRELRPEEVKK